MTALLVAFGLGVVFLAVGAAGVWGLRRQQVALAAPNRGPAEVEAEADRDAERDVGADATPADALIRASPAPGGRTQVVDGAGPGRSRPAPAPAPGPPVPPPPLPAGPFDLSALEAITHGREIRVESLPGGFAVAGWRDPQAWVEWPIGPRAPGWYSVEVSFACADGGGGNFVVAVADQTLAGRAGPTGGWGNYHTAKLGNVHLTPEEQRLQVRPAGEIAGALMNVRGVRLVPAP